MPSGEYSRTREFRESLAENMRRIRNEWISSKLVELKETETTLRFKLEQELNRYEDLTLLDVVPNPDKEYIQAFKKRFEDNPYDLSDQIAMVDFMIARIHAMRSIFMAGRKMWTRDVESRLLRFDRAVIELLKLRESYIKTRFTIENAKMITIDQLSRIVDFIQSIIQTTVKQEDEKVIIAERFREIPALLSNN